jgi:short subunit dehydrogenase-like uncharacterized protein
MRKIGLLGATGYTGKLTATEFALRELPVRLGARNAERLAAVDGHADSERVVVDTSNPKALAAFLDGLDVVISTVGPFSQLGKPVVAAAVKAGVHYIDSTGEPDFMQHCYDTYADAATAVVPACGFDYAPGDCAAAVAAKHLQHPVERITVGYAIHGMKPSRGTARSSLDAVSSIGGTKLGRTEIEGHPAISLPWGEDLTIPRWAPGAVVTCAVTAPKAAQILAPLTAPLVAPTFKLAGPLLRRLVERLPEGPTDDVRSSAKTRVVATATARGESATVSVDIDDVYGFTAITLVEFALQVEGTGALAPSQAVDSAKMLAALQGPLLSWLGPPAPVKTA